MDVSNMIHGANKNNDFHDMKKLMSNSYKNDREFIKHKSKVKKAKLKLCRFLENRRSTPGFNQK